MKSQISDLKFQIEKGVLLLGIQRVQGIIDRRSTVPILSNVLLEGQISTLNIIATDLEIGVRGSYPANIQGEGAIAVSGKKLHDIIRELPDGVIDIAVEDGKYVTIRAGKGYFKIAGSNKEDFPAILEATEDRVIEIDSQTYGEMIRKTLFAVADADARHVLNGALLEIEGDGEEKAKIRMVGTDGHRLAICERSLDTSPTVAGIPKRQMIVPKKTLQELRRYLDVYEKISIGLGEKLISFKGGDTFITSRLIEGIYPSYSQVIPKKGEQIARVERSNFMSVVRRVSVMSREKTKAILIEFSSGKAILRAKDPEIGEAMEEIGLNYKGESLTFGINCQYLLEALESMNDEEIILEMQTGLTPCVIKEGKDPGHLCIVMPMRIQEME